MIVAFIVKNIDMMIFFPCFEGKLDSSICKLCVLTKCDFARVLVCGK